MLTTHLSYKCEPVFDQSWYCLTTNSDFQRLWERPVARRKFISFTFFVLYMTKLNK